MERTEFSADLLHSAEALLAAMRQDGLKLTTAESCTGGLISGVLTEIAGASDVYERGFVTYSNASKVEVLAVPSALIDRHGAVSAHVARAMVEGALKHSRADVGVAVTGIAGPGGGTDDKPVGLVYIAVERRGGDAQLQRCTFGSIGRGAIRVETVRTALGMLHDLMKPQQQS